MEAVTGCYPQLERPYLAWRQTLPASPPPHTHTKEELIQDVLPGSISDDRRRNSEVGKKRKKDDRSQVTAALVFFFIL